MGNLKVNSKSTIPALKAFLDQEKVTYASTANKDELLSLAGVDLNAEIIADKDAEIEALKEDNKALSEQIAEWKGATKKETPKQAKKPTVPTGKFKAGEDEYKFKVAIFNLPGFGMMKSSDALKNDKACARLVSIKAFGIIEKC